MEPYARVTKLQDLGLQHMQAMVDQSALTVAGRLRLSSVGCPIEEWVDTCRNVRFFLLSVQQRNCEVALLVFLPTRFCLFTVVFSADPILDSL